MAAAKNSINNIRRWMFNNYERFVDKSGNLECTAIAELACDSLDDYGEYNHQTSAYDIPEEYYETAVDVAGELAEQGLINE